MQDRDRKLKQIPVFASEAEERAFWESHDSTDYVDWSQAKKARFPNLRPTAREVSLQLPESLFSEIRAAAEKRGVSWQSLVRVWLAEKVKEC